jgi:hypothetical protein
MIEGGTNGHNFEVPMMKAANDLSLEKHYTVAEIADLWNWSRQTVVRIFENEPGVLRYGREESRYKRSYFSLRVPESVLKRIHARLRSRAA